MDVEEAVLAYIKVLFRHLYGGTEEHHEILSQDSRSPVLDWNPGSPEYGARVLTDRPWGSLLLRS
jgi:hypothetical protein